MYRVLSSVEHLRRGFLDPETLLLLPVGFNEVYVACQKLEKALGSPVAVNLMYDLHQKNPLIEHRGEFGFIEVPNGPTVVAFGIGLKPPGEVEYTNQLHPAVMFMCSHFGTANPYKRVVLLCQPGEMGVSYLESTFRVLEGFGAGELVVTGFDPNEVEIQSRLQRLRDERDLTVF